MRGKDRLLTHALRDNAAARYLSAPSFVIINNRDRRDTGSTEVGVRCAIQQYVEDFVPFARRIVEDGDREALGRFPGRESE